MVKTNKPHYKATGKYKTWCDENLSTAVTEEIAIASQSIETDMQNKVDDIEILFHSEPELGVEWYNRIIDHYQLHNIIRIDIIMQYLYNDWYEATVNWYKYGSMVGEMLQQYINEVENQLAD